MPAGAVSANFITEIIERDLERGAVNRVVTRFPPEPNGYAHLGHTFACNLNFALAQQYGGEFVLRMDDTNPLTERQEYVDAIRADLEWMGWRVETMRYASDDFEVMYQCAEQLIEKELAYVDSVPPEEMARLRGTVDRPGTPSPYRDRSVQENLEVFRAMRTGAHPDGAHLLRAKIDLGSPNMKLRDPGLYRILHAPHYRQGSAWCIYPLYDYAQALNDAINGVTHSLCSLEFVDNRAIYDWLLDHLEHPAFKSRPHQYEFGRRALEYTVVSKRKLRRLIETKVVGGWDDPRMPTLAAQRRRGVTPDALRAFASNIGVSRTNRTVDIGALEHAIRDDLNHRAPRVMAVLRPVRLTIQNLESDLEITMPYFPQDVVREAQDGHVPLPSGERVPAEQATRALVLTRDLYIERDDISDNPPPGYKRLTLGGRVRLRGAGVVQCTEIKSDDAGNVLEAICELLPEPQKAGGVIHWVSATHGVPFTARLYDRLFKVPNPELEAKELEDDEDSGDERDFLSFLNPDSLEETRGFIEPSVLNDPKDARYQFERNGYFWQDPVDSSPDALVFNRIITLKDNWANAVISSTTQNPNTAQGKFTVGAKHASPSQPQPTLELTAEEQAMLETLKAKGLNEADALMFARDAELRAYLEQTSDPVSSAGFVSAFGLRADAKVSPAQLSALVALVTGKSINRNTAKTVLERALETGDDPVQIIEREGLRQVSDTSSLEPIVLEVFKANPDKLEAYRGGRTGLLGFFVGEVMKRTKGAGNPGVVQALVRAKLEG
jgi:glutaminyl-tRNA synthetase